jgi:hypothetical protein
MASAIPFPEFKKRFRRWGFLVKSARKHYILVGEVDGKKDKYPFPMHNNEVLAVYGNAARKRFKLTPKDGVSNAQFRKKR